MEVRQRSFGKKYLKKKIRMQARFRRWIPFILFSVLIIVFNTYFLLSAKSSDYQLVTDDPAVIYHEACAHCYGKNRQSENWLYPDLIEEDLNVIKVKEIITKGELMMPAFKKIKGDTLQNLAEYVAQKRFK